MKTLVLVLSLIAAAAGYISGIVVTCRSGNEGKTKTLVLVLSLIVAAAAFSANDVNYHLFTRNQAGQSTPLLPQQPATIANSDFSAARPTKVLIHGTEGIGELQFASHAINGFLEADDVNIILVDWNAGRDDDFYTIGLVNTFTAASGVTSFLLFLISSFQLQVGQLHLVGFNLGAHVAGIVGRNLPGTVSYITALDPALHGWTHHPQVLTANDAAVVEVLHTNANINGFGRPLGTIDFYANNGVNQPGCISDECSHSLSFVFFGEALSNEVNEEPNFVGTECADAAEALSGSCSGESTLTFGTLAPKLGVSGIYHFNTNPVSPHAQG